MLAQPKKEQNGWGQIIWLLMQNNTLYSYNTSLVKGKPPVYWLYKMICPCYFSCRAGYISIGSNFSKSVLRTQTTPIYTQITTPLLNITTPQTHPHYASAVHFVIEN